MENQAKTGMTILNCIKQYASYIREFTKALVGNDEELINDVNSIPDITEYKNKNINNQDIQKDIEELTKIQKALDKKKEQVQKAKNGSLQIKNQETRNNKKHKVIEDKEKE